MSYRSIHQILARKYGRAASHTCPCGRPARHWAYQHTGVTLLDKGREYTDDPKDYAPMCMSCHRTLDMLTQANVAAAVLDAGRRLGEFQQARFAANPLEANESQTRAAKMGAAAMRELRQDPAFRAANLAATNENLRRGREVFAEKRKDPEFAARSVEAMHDKTRAGRNTRRCSECPMLTNLSGIARHQRASGHTGWEVVA